MKRPGDMRAGRIGGREIKEGRRDRRGETYQLWWMVAPLPIVETLYIGPA